MLDIEWRLVLTTLSQIGSAYLLALPVAWDREDEARSAGIRTFPLVSVAACGYMLVGIQVLNPGSCTGSSPAWGSWALAQS